MQKSAVTETIHRLPTMDRTGLVRLWEEHFGRTPSGRLRPELMRPVLAFRIQEVAYGGNSAATKLKLKQITDSLKPACRATGEAHNRFKAGTRIIREWGGKTYEVQVYGDGYEFEGRTYKSLSPIATQITGTRWSDPAFFGTKRPGGLK